MSVDVSFNPIAITSCNHARQTYKWNTLHFVNVLSLIHHCWCCSCFPVGTSSHLGVLSARPVWSKYHRSCLIWFTKMHEQIVQWNSWLAELQQRTRRHAGCFTEIWRSFSTVNGKSFEETFQETVCYRAGQFTYVQPWLC